MLKVIDVDMNVMFDVVMILVVLGFFIGNLRWCFVYIFCICFVSCMGKWFVNEFLMFYLCVSIFVFGDFILKVVLFFVVENWRVKEMDCMMVIVDELIKVK